LTKTYQLGYFASRSIGAMNENYTALPNPPNQITLPRVSRGEAYREESRCERRKWALRRPATKIGVNFRKEIAMNPVAIDVRTLSAAEYSAIVNPRPTDLLEGIREHADARFKTPDGDEYALFLNWHPDRIYFLMAAEYGQEALPKSAKRELRKAAGYILGLGQSETRPAAFPEHGEALQMWADLHYIHNVPLSARETMLCGELQPSPATHLLN
jgi:hypothetical protein